MIFTTITEDLQKELKKNLAQIRFLLKKIQQLHTKRLVKLVKMLEKNTTLNYL